MKPQDLVFFIVFIGLLLSKRPKLLVIAGLVSFVLAIPLFATWTFFTAQRLTWYGALFIVASLLLK